MQWYESGTFSWYFSGMGQREADADLFNPLAAKALGTVQYRARSQAYRFYEMAG
jgi:hypothetical protein